MTSVFLPEANCKPVGNQFAPLYRWFRGEAWRPVPGMKTYPTQAEAIGAAQDFLASGLNTDRGERSAPDILGIEDWRSRKAGEIDADRRVVFGEQPSMVRNKSGRMATVESRKRRRA